MDVSELLTDALSRVTDQVPTVVADLGEEDLAWQPGPGANSIAWLVWHLTRVADLYSAGFADAEPRWTEGGWYDRFDLPFGPEAHGYGMDTEQVAQVRTSAENLAGYYADVEPVLRGYLRTLTPVDLDDVVDRGYDPPVTRGVRLVSIVDDLAQHIGQAAYVRGLWERRGVN